MKLRNIVLSLILLGSSVSLIAQNSRALPILEINPSARAVGMGGNQLGEAKDMFIYSNPTSFLYGEPVWHVSGSTQIYKSLEDAGRQMFYAAAASVRLGRHGINAGLRYLGGLSIAPDTGKDIKPVDWTVDLTYALRLSDHFSVAVGGSFIQSQIKDTGNAPAFNVSAYYRNSFDMKGVDASFVIGANGANIGPELDYGKGSKVKLPTSCGLGGEFDMNFNDEHHVALSLAGQYYFLPEKASMFTGNVGAEYIYANMLSARAGFVYAEHDHTRLTIGGGFKYKIAHVDAAYEFNPSYFSSATTFVTLGVTF